MTNFNKLLKPPSRRELALIDRALEKLGVKKRQAAEGLRTEGSIIVYELVPPYRKARIVFFLQALDVPWLKEKVDFSIRGNLVYAGGEVVALIRRPRR